MLGLMWNPRMGSSSVPVTNVKMLDNDSPCLLPPENIASYINIIFGSQNFSKGINNYILTTI
jgi:hypothetical protein